MNKAILQIFTAILVLGLFCGAATAIPSVSGDATPPLNSTVNWAVGTTQTFSIPFNETATVIWNVNNGENTPTQTDSNNIATLSHVVQSGAYQVTASVEGLGKISTWNVNGVAAAVPVITLSDPSSSSVTDNIGASRTFTATVDQKANMTWYLDDVQVQENASVTTSSYARTSTQGSHTIRVEAQNENGTADSKSWTWAVSENGVPVSSDPSEGTIEINQGKSKTFSVSSNTSGQNINVEWFINNVTQKTDSGVTSSSYEFGGNNTGEYILKAVTSDPNGVYTQSTKTWTVKVEASTSGNRIWEEGMPTTYTWNAQSYSGFYYDLNKGVSSENMTITDIGRTIDSGNIEYSTTPTETDFEYGSWGTYQIIGFMAEKYFAGYTEDGSKVIKDDISPISDGILSKILIDSDDKKSANTGESLTLEEGYSLNIVEVDVNGNSVWVQLEKDGDVVDEAFVSSGQDYVYKADLGKAEDVPIIIVHFGTVFSGTETSAVFIQGLFQISDEYVEIANGDTFGEMEVTSVSSNQIKMKNEDSIGLDEGDTVDLMGKVKLQVADDSKLRFAPILDTSESGTYELRGTVYDESDANPVTSWTPFNFEGFYYNIDEGIGTESLTVEGFGDNEIPSDKLIYKSTPQAVKFEHSDWGNFTVVGFMADKYFAGYEDGAVDGQVDGVSLLSDNILCKVLTDSDDKESMNSGSALTLGEGYSMNIKEVDVNGNSVWIQLEKDGEVVDDGFVSSGQDYIYETDLGKAENIPLIIIHFGTVFSGTETSAVFIQGIFQLSDDYTEINNGDTFGEMEVTSVSENGITMKNSDDIGLGRDTTAEIMGNVSFKTADASTLRFYPFVEVKTGDEGSSSSNSLKITVPDEIYAGDTFNIEVTAAGEPVEGATITVNETDEGKTNVDGVLEYTAEEVGTLKITAEKEDYTKANKNIDVNPPKEQMSLNISPETVYVGDTVTVEALKKIGGDPIEGANVSINGKVYGETGSDGKITYKTEDSGTLKVSVAKEGFANESTSLKVKNLEAIFKVSNLVVDPLEVSAGKNTTISANIENTGNAAGEYIAELSVNGSVVNSKNVSLGIGENTTLTFEHSEEVPGTYNAEIGGEIATYTVKEKSSMLLYALGVVALLIIGGIAYFFTKGGGDIEMLQQKVQELMNSIKLRK